MRSPTPWPLLLGLVVLLRLPYLWFPVQGDDAFYLAMAQHALIDPAHPNHFKLIAQGNEVDMRGFPKPPGNAWILAGSIALLSGGEIREPVLHAVYASFSLLALWAVWELGLLFCALPQWGVLLFAAVPAFVINGNSLEADLPFVAFFLAGIALFVRAVEEESTAALVLSAACSIAAALIEYKAIALTPLAALYLWRKRRDWAAGWAAALAPAIAIADWQLYERVTTGAAGAEVLTGYFQSRGLQSGPNKLRNALALTVHAGWMVSPLLTAATFARLDWAAAGLAAVAGAALCDTNPLFWLPFGVGAALIARAARQSFAAGGYLEAWLAGFYVFALIVFFAGSARYLLPAAAPLVFLTLNRLCDRSRGLLGAGLALQLALSLALNHANFEHWSAYRSAVAQWTGPLGEHRSWVGGDMGLRFYAESAGAAPLKRGQSVRPGDVVITSQLAGPMDHTLGGGAAVPFASVDVRPSLPLRLYAVNSRSAYSLHQGGLRAFDIDAEPADRITAVRVVERPPVLSFLSMNAPEAAFQLAAGAYSLEDNSWRWTMRRVVAILKRPRQPAPVAATFRIVDASPARAARLLVDGVTAAEATYPGPGLFTLRTAQPVRGAAETVTVTLVFDKWFRPPNDARELAVILTGIGFLPD